MPNKLPIADFRLIPSADSRLPIVAKNRSLMITASSVTSAKKKHGQRNGHRNGQTDRLTDKQTDRQEDRQTGRQTDRQA